MFVYTNSSIQAAAYYKVIILYFFLPLACKKGIIVKSIFGAN